MSADDEEPTPRRRSLMEEALYEKASELFAARGYAGTSLQDIARAMGVSRPSLYHYISSKDELLERLTRDITGTAAAIVAQVAMDSSLAAPEKLHSVVLRMIRLVAAQPARFRLLDRSEGTMPDHLTRAHDALKRGILDDVTSILREGQRRGVFRPVDPRIAALGIIGTWNWVAWWHSRGDIGEAALQLAESAVRGQLAGAAPTEGVTPASLVASMYDNLARLETMLDAPRPTDSPSSYSAVNRF